MWTLKQLVESQENMTEINGRWVPVRPENFKPKNLSIIERLKIIFAVWSGRAEAFTWPEGQ